MGLLLLAAGCTGADLGDCDLTGALEVVYTPTGQPMFAGQAVLHTSCGGGVYCHSGPDLSTEARFGAPADLDYDLSLASTTATLNRAEHRRLSDNQHRVLADRQRIYDAILGGHVLGDGAGFDALRSAGAELAYDRFDEEGYLTGPRPSLLAGSATERAEAVEIVRDWLACGVPAVEGTVPSRVPEPVGWVIPSCEHRCTDAAWPAIHEQVIATCAICHNGYGRLDLSGDASDVYERILDAPAISADCLGSRILVPGRASESLLVVVPEADPTIRLACAVSSHVTPRASAQHLCALRAWVACGACREADGGACAPCVAEARARCNVDATGQSCIEPIQSPSRANLDGSVMP